MQLPAHHLVGINAGDLRVEALAGTFRMRRAPAVRSLSMLAGCLASFVEFRRGASTRRICISNRNDSANTIAML